MGAHFLAAEWDTTIRLSIVWPFQECQDSCGIVPYGFVSPAMSFSIHQAWSVRMWHWHQLWLWDCYILAASFLHSFCHHVTSTIMFRFWGEKGWQKATPMGCSLCQDRWSHKFYPFTSLQDGGKVSVFSQGILRDQRSRPCVIFVETT